MIRDRLVASTAAFIAVVGSNLLPSLASTQDRPTAGEGVHVLSSGAYSFSDELGGFVIRSVTGRGTEDDPFVIREELQSATPVTLVIRTVRPIQPFDLSNEFANGFMHVRLEVLNNSNHAWVEFELELQEIRDEPSTFGDGLSFDQRRTDSKSISSDSFRRFDRDYEPYDRLLYGDGKIDPLESGTLGFMITDFTPKREFYLVQDPRIPSS